MAEAMGNAGARPGPGRSSTWEHRDMAGHDAELDQFRNDVSCAALLERLPPPWHLDKQGSTRHALKYRRGEGEVLIVTHDGRGWWDPRSAAKGGVIDLVQHLDPSLSLGQVRQILRPFIGLSPEGGPACVGAPWRTALPSCGCGISGDPEADPTIPASGSCRARPDVRET